MAETVVHPNNVKVAFKGKATREKPRLPRHIRKAHKRGLISDKQIDRIREGK